MDTDATTTTTVLLHSAQGRRSSETFWICWALEVHYIGKDVTLWLCAVGSGFSQLSWLVTQTVELDTSANLSQVVNNKCQDLNLLPKAELLNIITMQKKKKFFFTFPKLLRFADFLIWISYELDNLAL